MIVEVGSEIEQLVFKIRARPEQCAIQTLPPYRSVMWPIQLCGVARVNAYFEGFSRFSAPHN